MQAMVAAYLEAVADSVVSAVGSTSVVGAEATRSDPGVVPLPAPDHATPVRPNFWRRRSPDTCLGLEVAVHQRRRFLLVVRIVVYQRRRSFFVVGIVVYQRRRPLIITGAGLDQPTWAPGLRFEQPGGGSSLRVRYAMVFSWRILLLLSLPPILQRLLLLHPLVALALVVRAIALVPKPALPGFRKVDARVLRSRGLARRGWLVRSFALRRLLLLKPRLRPPLVVRELAGVAIPAVSGPREESAHCELRVLLLTARRRRRSPRLLLPSFSFSASFPEGP
jgi:hypothetical protein